MNDDSNYKWWDNQVPPKNTMSEEDRLFLERLQNLPPAPPCVKCGEHPSRYYGYCRRCASDITDSSCGPEARFYESETVKLAAECGAEDINTFEDAIEYLRWYTSATGRVTSPGIAIKGWPMSGFVNYKKQQRESE